mmetsp:Transcript_30329/g.92764  ORF Transcript_30329/g.92764 Transcript_30329/m.92764 type:complete len:529 (+) Transcript_30329:74-1660(+)
MKRVSETRRCRRWLSLGPRTMNQQVVEAKYAVRGALLDRAMEIERELPSGKWPFQEIIRCNIGNPQALGQRPPRFSRQVLSLLMNPELLGECPPGLFSEEAVARAEAYRAGSVGGLGAYTDSKGLEVVRQEVAAFIEARDGYACDAEDVHLSDGASAAVKHTLALLLTGATEDALMVPFPQYPLYTALVTLAKGTTVPYFPDESRDWDVTRRELEASYAKAVARGVTPRAFVCINPGNPTGASLRRESLEDVVKFCQDKQIALLADEVYQANVYGGAPPFTSLRKVVKDLGIEDVPLFSYHSVSKGFTGECGLRGGYVELTNVREDFKDQMVKLASLSLCSNVPGQVAVGLMVKPPSSETESRRYQEERDAILASLVRRSTMLADALDALPGVSCPRAQGALYVFPSITLPPKAIDAARREGLAPDAFYSMRLLETTGLVVVPGDGFGQKEGTFHFRSTFLPPEDQLKGVLSRLQAFHTDFIREFADAAAAEEGGSVVTSTTTPAVTQQRLSVVHNTDTTGRLTEVSA